jgi:hypothetical protein
MSEFLVGDLCTALRALDEKLKAHVQAMDEKPMTLTAAPPQPAAGPSPAAVVAAGANCERRNDKVNLTFVFIPLI